jgi:acetyl esterase/lipase
LSVKTFPPNSPWHRTLAEAPIPVAVSEQARELFKIGLPTPESAAQTLAEHRAICDEIQMRLGRQRLLEHPLDIREAVVAGVPVRVFEPRSPTAADDGRVLLNLHGGGFTKDSGSLTENIPIAHLTGVKVIAPRYRLAPEHPFPAARDDAVSVYAKLLESYSADRIGVYGTSAGAILSVQTLVRLQQMKLPLPAALGFFSGSADLSAPGESEYFFPLVDDPRELKDIIAPYIGSRDPRDPEISPLRSDLAGFPPTLCICGGRDLMLSQTTIFHRALLGSCVSAQLVVFEAMPHAHWSYLDLPESEEAFRIMATFLSSHVK